LYIAPLEFELASISLSTEEMYYVCMNVACSVGGIPELSGKVPKFSQLGLLKHKEISSLSLLLSSVMSY
jgi:hypothetical protein